ncbi:MAG: COX15/CtaA family protein, partial [Polaromonas sp.]
ILTLTLVSWLERKRGQFSAGPPQGKYGPLGGQRSTRSDKRGGYISPWWPTVTLVWVCLQGAFGALTVTMKLFPAIVTLHLLGGLVLLALLRAQAVRYAQAQEDSAPVAMTLSAGSRRFVIAAFALLWLQVALGGWVSTNYAVLACTDFPSCQNSLWPAMDFQQGFTLWRELGAGHDGANISFQALTAIHYAHRLAAYAVFAALLLLAAGLYRVQAFRIQACWLAGLTLLQAATGLGNVVLGWPLVAAVMHTGGAAALVLVLTGIVFSSRGSRQTLHASKLKTSRLFA